MGVTMGLKRLVTAWANGFQAETDRLTKDAAKLHQFNDRQRSEIEQIRAETAALRQQRMELRERENVPVGPQEKTLTFRFAKDVLETEAKIRTLGPASQELCRAVVYGLFLPHANNAAEASFLERHLGPGRTF